jgi:formylglycine-generating enzyme required for sulfatase activity
MTLVPGGAFIMGKSDDDVASIQDAPTKTVTVRSFYMKRNYIVSTVNVDWVKTLQ